MRIYISRQTKRAFWQVILVILIVLLVLAVGLFMGLIMATLYEQYRLTR